METNLLSFEIIDLSEITDILNPSLIAAKKMPAGGGCGGDYGNCTSGCGCNGDGGYCGR